MESSTAVASGLKAEGGDGETTSVRLSTETFTWLVCATYGVEFDLQWDFSTDNLTFVDDADSVFESAPAEPPTAVVVPVKSLE